MRTRPGFVAMALVLAMTGVAVPAAAGPWDGPAGSDQPRLSQPVPAPVAAGAHADGDFDGDGVTNAADNCLLVANPGQEAAVHPEAAADDPLAAQWKADHPDAAFRLDSEVGEACSGYSDNYRRTFEALRLSPHDTKLAIYRFLGASGPMFGRDRLALAVPQCSNWQEMSRFPQWMLDTPTWPGGEPEEFECAQGEWAQHAEDQGMRSVWAGKRLDTGPDGGTITNRFFPFATEHPGFATFAAQPALRTFFPNGNGQTVKGRVILGASIMDGRDAVIIDWRNSFPASASMGGYGWLVYDECRGIQTGVYHCTAMVDIVNGERRLFWHEGYMPWDLKNPSIEAYLQWRRAQ